MDTVICCIAKNEELYIEEWINYHFKLGFSKIYIYDNTDNNILKYLDSNNIKIIHFPGICKQYTAYNNFFNNFKHHHKYCAIIDCDEFINLKIHNNINHFNEDYIIDSGIAINWRLYGSNGHEQYSNEPVINRFTMCQENLNPHVKCIVKCSNILQYNNPHIPTKYIGNIHDINKNIINGPFNENGSYNIAQINHYFTKSREEFELKRLRGMADCNIIRNPQEFDSHNLNEVKDLIIIKEIMTCVICCIAKNEDLYIQEWIDYNLKIGFTKIYIYDNSDENSLKHLDSDNIKITHFPGLCKQFEAYCDFSVNYKNNHTYCAYIDCDEFIVMKKHKYILELCNDYINNHCGGLAINWKFFGSNGHEQYSNEPVLKRFTRCQKGVNEHVKCIVKCENLLQYNNPHFPTQLNGHVKDTNNNIVIGPYNNKGTDDIVQINHYFTKSREEFELKCNRGRADVKAKRNLAEFGLHDFNEIEEIIYIQ